MYYLALNPTDEKKRTLKSIKNYGIISSILLKSKNNSDDYDKKYNKVKLNSDNIPLEKTLDMHEVVIVITLITSVFNDVRKYYPLVFLDVLLHKLDE